jgi:UDP-N-acetylglucosamine acyltransferase
MGEPAETRIGKRNRIREFVTIHRGTEGGGLLTEIGDDCLIMAQAHIAHDCRLGNEVIMANGATLAGHVVIDDRANIGAYSGVHQFCRIGRLAMIGGHSKIVQDCLPFVITDGDPGRARGLNVVGLQRAGVTAADIQKLKEGYRLLLRSGLPLEHALQRLTDLGNPLVDHLISFVRNSTRGFCHEDNKERRAKV